MKSNGASPSIALPLLALSSFFFSLAVSDPRITEAGRICENSTWIVAGNIVSDLIAIMNELSDGVAAQRWWKYSLATPTLAVYGLIQCHGDLTETDYDFYNETVDPTHDMLKCSSNLTVPTERVAEFSDRVDRVLRNVSTSAVRNKGFAVAGEDGIGGVAGVYALAQCWSTLDAGGCRFCLENATSMARNCAPGEARAMNAGCFLRYSTTKFYDVPDGGGNNVLISGLPTYKMASSPLKKNRRSSMSACKPTLGKLKPRQPRCNKPQDLASSNLPGAGQSKFSLYFKYKTLEKATNFFDDSRKLGQGGGGFVYKGILPDRKVVAVKRLVFNTCQWADDFFNEVNLISGIRHKNLMRILGCSIEGPESLLVYEYLPKRSLDLVLFVNDATPVLTWEERLNIIIGIAEGLSYLHGGCGVKIIHRDIKSSNILLDENLTAKISDFGLARCIALDKSHLSTKIAGTIGYMAPEYIMRGQLMEKVDVYAFGVLVLEILSGRKNSVYARGSSSVLRSVWKHYKSNNLAACIDSALQGKFPILEASNVLQIGLLCTQACMELRPPMSGVVEMLHNKNRVVPQPNQPPFINASLLFDKSSSRSST
ncbi:cysteine-rich receptor-like protein kinase 1 [Eucalyptus grandis]|uniref:cysteine-rich receptor-like protein kinase 1 n=1 Tax=Eucalyptus grandis TaxID=71139 RepID=UPI00192EE735|nr:cysteine-rich receptor-like protein kinase 1 [Eucalyptus grandis]